jgi:hypothetical protein
MTHPSNPSSPDASDAYHASTGAPTPQLFGHNLAPNKVQAATATAAPQQQQQAAPDVAYTPADLMDQQQPQLGGLPQHWQHTWGSAGSGFAPQPGLELWGPSNGMLESAVAAYQGLGSQLQYHTGAGAGGQLAGLDALGAYVVDGDVALLLAGGGAGLGQLQQGQQQFGGIGATVLGDLGLQLQVGGTGGGLAYVDDGLMGLGQ